MNTQEPKDAPDAPGYWWFKCARTPNAKWEIVDAIDYGQGRVMLYGKGWGGYPITSAKQQLPGKWISIPEPTIS